MSRGAHFIAFLAGYLLSALALRAADEMSNPVARVYTSRDAGAPTNAWTVEQNDRGEMFFGCGGVVSFDGTRWQDHPIPGTYAVRGLAADGARLWLAAFNEVGYLDRDATGHYAYTSLSPHLAPADRDLDYVWNVFVDSGATWFVANQKLLRWRNGKFERWDFPGPRRLSGFQVGGHTYVQHRGSGLYLLTPGEPKRVIDDAVLGGKLIVWAETQEDGQLLFATNQGFYRWDGHALRNVAPQFNEFMRTSYVACIRRLGNGQLLLGSLVNGLVVIDRDWSRLTQVDLTEFARGAGVNGMGVDRAGAVWVVGLGYVARIDPASGAHRFAGGQGVEGEMVEPLWVENGKATFLTPKNLYAAGPNDQQVTRLYHDSSRVFEYTLPWRDGHLVGFTGGIEYVSGGQLRGTVATVQDVLFIGRSRLHPGRFFYTDNMNLRQADDTGDFPLSGHLVAAMPDMVTTLAERDDGTLLLGTPSRGLWRLEPQASEPRAVPLVAVSVPGRDTTWVYRVGPRNLAFTAAGVFDVTGPAEEPVRLLDTYPGGGQPLVVGAPNDRAEVWMVLQTRQRLGLAGRYLARFALDGNRTPRFRAFDFPALEKMPWVKSIATDPEGDDTRVWVEGSGGVLTAVLANEATLRRPSRPMLAAVESKKGPVALTGDRIELPFEASDLTFDLAAVDYEFQAELELQNRLVGFDDGWVKVAATGERTIAHLPPGDYEFQMRAVTPAGAISPEASWRFTIAPPWFRTRLALLGFALAAASLLVGLYQFRTRAIRRRNVWLEEQVRQRTAELEKANSAKTVFVASMSHEIRNPIHGILGLAYSLEGTPLNVLQQQYVGHIRQCANFLTSLVRDVLDFAKIEQEEVSLEIGLFEPATLIETTVSMCETKAQQAGMTIHTEVDKQLPGHLVGDSARIQQVLLNYLANAIKYAGQGEIVLRAQLAGRTGTEVSVRFSVSDTGPGVPPAEQEKLFTKFSRGRMAQEHSIHGTGLGLAISEKIARRMGGRVGMVSDPGLGAQFWVEVPLQVAAASPATPLAAAERASGRVRVLVADDETYNTLALAGMLQRLGCEVETVNDGATALDRLLAGDFQVAFLDWELPGCSGIEIARTYRTQQPRSATYLVAITAYNTEHNRAACLAAGMNAFLAKPVHLRQLAETLTEVSLNHADLAAEPPAAGPVEAGTGSVSLRLLHYACRAQGKSLPRALEEFTAKVGRDLDLLGISLGQREKVEAQKAAHALAGHGAFIGADRLNQQARRVHEHTGADEFPEALAVLSEIRAEWRAIKDTLELRLASEVSG